MVDWYIVAECEWLGPSFGQSEYLDMNGYTEGTMDSQDIQTDGEVGDPFLAYGIDTQTWAFGQAQMEIGLIGSHRIRINSSGVRIWTAGDVWEDPLTGGGGGDLNDLDDVVITGTPADNEGLFYDTSTSKWINQTAAEAGLATTGDLHSEAHVLATTGPHTDTLPWTDLNKTGSNLTDLATRQHAGLTDITSDQHHPQIHYHNGETLQHDGVNSGGGAFSFSTTGTVSFNQAISVAKEIILTEIAEPSTPSADTLKLYAFDESGFTTLRFIEPTGKVIIIGECMYKIGRNTSGSEIAKGKLVSFNGTTTGKHPNFSLAKADALATMPVIGITCDVVANNAWARLMIMGRFDGLDTYDYENGDVLYASASTAGEMIDIFPPSPLIDQQVGIVEVKHAVTGVVLIDLRTMQGRNDGTIHQSFQIGDGASGDVTLAFNGDALNDGSIVWDVSEDEFVFNYPINGYYSSSEVDGLLHPQAHDLASHSTKAHSELTDYNAEADVKHITDAQQTALHDVYTNAQAVQAVEDAGLVLASTKVITSADEDLTFTFGRVKLFGSTDYAYFSHKDFGTYLNFALRQSPAGATYLNAVAGQTITFGINRDDRMVLGNTLLTMSVPIDMQTNLLTVGHSTDDSDPIELLKFETERGWSFRKRGVGAQARLALESDVDSKQFWIGYDNGTAWCAKFTVNSVQANNILYLQALSVAANIAVGGTVDGVDVGDLKTAFDALSYYTQAELNGGQLDNRYYTETEIDDNTYTRAQVDAHNWLETDITDLDHLTEGEISLANLLEKSHASLTNVTANQHIDNLTDIPTRNHNDLLNIDAGDINHLTDVQVTALHSIVTQVYNLRALDDRDYKPNTANSYGFVKAFFTSLGGMTGVSDSDYQDLLILNTYTDGTGGDINALTFDKSEKLIKHWLADQAAATWGTPETLAYISNITTEIALLKEQSAAFPGAPSEGDFHYDEDDDSLYRYNAEALAWVEVGTMGAIASSTDNLGNHTATEDLDMATNNIINVVDPVNAQDAATKNYVLDKAICGIASDDLVFSNDTERSTVNDFYFKVKEITVHRSLNLRVYWESKTSNSAFTAYSKVYVNGIAVGAEKSTQSDVYVEFTEDITVNNGDLVQIYAKISVLLNTSYVQNMRLKFIEYTITAGY